MSKDRRMLRVLVLSDGAHGHVSQSQGIVDALSEKYIIDNVVISVRVKSRILKHLGRVMLHWGLVPELWLRLVYQINLSAFVRPDLIISSGANTLLANGLMAQYFGVPNVYSGTLRKYPESCYSVVFSVISQPHLTNNCVLPLPPVPFEIYGVSPLEVSRLSKEVSYVAVLVGGNGGGCLYQPDDWVSFARLLVQICEQKGYKLLLTTSRRTSPAAEIILKEAIPNEFIVDAVWWSEAPRAAVREYLSLAEIIIVTEDSLTMIAESIYARRPVFTLAPKKIKIDENDEAALRKYEQSGFIKRNLIRSNYANDEVDEVFGERFKSRQTFPSVPNMIIAAIQPYLV